MARKPVRLADNTDGLAEEFLDEDSFRIPSASSDVAEEFQNKTNRSTSVVSTKHVTLLELVNHYSICAT